MADDPLANATEKFSAPIEHLIIALGAGVAEAQRELDRSAIQSQEAIDSDPVLSQHGLQATWYQLPRVDLELKLSITIAEEQSPGDQAAGPPGPGGGGAVPAGPAGPRRARLVAQPVSASFQTHFNYDAQAASQITLSIVPVPPPRTGSQVTSPPARRPEDVQALALGTGKFVTDPQTKAPRASDDKGNVLRFDVNFNAVSRTWYALQYAPANPSIPATVVAVDDATGAVRVISPS